MAGILLLLMTKNLAPSNVLGFCVAASNAFGLIAGIFLMGYGLVAVPRQLWRTADTKNYRKLLFHRAGVQAEKALAAHAYVLIRAEEAVSLSCMHTQHQRAAAEAASKLTFPASADVCMTVAYANMLTFALAAAYWTHGLSLMVILPGDRLEFALHRQADEHKQQL